MKGEEPAEEEELEAPLYPEHERLQEIQPFSQKCGAFVEWLEETRKIRFRRPAQLQKALAEFFEIDEAKLEAEKLAMLDACRAVHEQRSRDDEEG